ncbi:hypothetical protein [Curtobacterium aetherium]|uniref:Uncharacterized protein n=1 Tax=Curtobacterium aetherium TaxID=2841594 RepID=A0ACD1E2Q6_9MICO|nr:hypothetical protein [Curtobacterium sp. L6-1]QWS33051.1 hypothetical protein KM842_12425 [Curtobacterium sp. L6-1]
MPAQMLSAEHVGWCRYCLAVARNRRHREQVPVKVRIGRALIWPLKPPARDSEHAWDLEAVAREERDVRTGLLSAGVALLPLGAALLAALNLLQQAHGDTRLTLAVLQNLSLTSLAFAVLFGLSTAVSAGLAIGFSSVSGDRSMPPSVRRAASLGSTALLIVTFYTQTATVFLFALGICYFFWRFPPKWLRARDRQQSGLPVEEWLQGSQPQDRVLRQLWQKARQHPAEMRPIAEKVLSRQENIAQHRVPGLLSAAWVVLWAIFGTYGYSLLTTPVQLAPLESVTFGKGASEVGYIFADSDSGGIFVYRDMRSVRRLDSATITARQLCWSPPSIFSRTLISAFNHEKRPAGRAEC